MQFAMFLIAGMLGLISLIVGFRGGVFGASDAREVDPFVNKVFYILGVLVLVFILLGAILPKLDRREPKSAAETRVVLPPDDKAIDELLTAIEARLKDEPVQLGSSKLFILKPADLQDSDKYRSIRVFLNHLSEKNIPSRTQISSEGEIVVFENLDKKYIEQWLEVFEKLNIRAWQK